MTPLDLWYAALEARAENVEILIGRTKAGAGEIEWFALSHANYDATGALGLVVSKQIGRAVEVPTRSPHDPGRSLCSIAPGVELFARTAGWLPTRFRPMTPPHVAAWDPDELARLRKIASAEACSVNSLLLWALHEAVVEETRLDRLDDGLWLVPVNLRTNPRPARYRGNHASFIMGSPGTNETPGALHADIAARLGRGEHWANAAWLARLGAGRVDTLAVNMGLLDVTSSAFVGLFSHVGDWNVPELAGERWYIAGPPTRMTPLFVTALCFNDALTLTARSVAFDTPAVERIVDRCRAIAIR